MFNKKLLNGLIMSDGLNLRIDKQVSLSNAILLSNVTLPSSTVYNGTHTINSLIVGSYDVQTSVSNLINNKATIINPQFNGTTGITFGNILVIDSNGNIASSNLIPPLDTSKITTGEFPMSRITGLSNAIVNRVVGSSINITACQASDSWIITTDNTSNSGTLEVFVTPAYDANATITMPEKENPKFTSNSTYETSVQWPSGLFEANASHNKDFAWRLFDKNIATDWESAAGTYDGTTGFIVLDMVWIYIKYPIPQFMKYYNIIYSTTLGGSPPREWQLEGSYDGVTWTFIQSYIKTSSWVNEQSYSFQVTTPHIPYTYWRLNLKRVNVSAATSNSGRCNLREVYFYTGLTSMGQISLLSAYVLDFNRFKIVLTDGSGEPLSIVGTTMNCKFNILITRGGYTVCSGLYHLFSNNTFQKVISL